MKNSIGEKITATYIALCVFIIIVGFGGVTSISFPTGMIQYSVFGIIISRYVYARNLSRTYLDVV